MRLNIIFLLLLGGMAVQAKTNSLIKNKPLNVILIMADDLSHYGVSIYGSKSYKTPNLDKLAKEGMLFKQCYALPLCTPSRVALMTGMHNGRNYIGGHSLDNSQVTFGELFKNAGYKTCLTGKWKLGAKDDINASNPRLFGFDEYCCSEITVNAPRYKNPKLGINGKAVKYSNGEYGPDIVNQYAQDFLERNKNNPFFLYYPLILVHEPHTPTPDQPEYATDQPDNKNFVYMVEYMDKMVGKLLAKLDELGLRNNTLIIFTGDNGNKKINTITLNDGTKYGGGKGLLSDEGVHEPLIVNLKGVVPVGVNNDLIDFTDFIPTLCEAANIKLPPNVPFDGQSFYPQILGKPAINPHRWIYDWYSNLGKLEQLQESAFTKNYRLYRTGKFFKCDPDFKEKTPLDVTQLNKDEEQAYQMLSGVLKDHDPVKVQHLSVDQKNITLKINQQKQLIVNVIPANTTQRSVKWITDNNKVVDVNKWGLITAIGKGSATIKINSFDDSQTTSVNINVKE